MWETLKIEEVRKRLKTNLYSGLTDNQVEERIKKYGKNVLKDKKKESIFIKFIKQFQDFMILILIAASIISATMAYIEGTGDYIDSIIIIAIVVFNAILGVIQESKAEKSLEALKKMSAPTANVKRNGRIITIKGEDVVPGDLVMLEAGGYVPADCRLISTQGLKVEESSLTGETHPVLKDAKQVIKENTSLGDILNMVFATTTIVGGHAEGIVTDIGMNTKLGKIANMIIEGEEPRTPIQKKLEQVGKTLGIACLAICMIVFVIGILRRIPASEMFMTSIGLAVAAIPEGLPAIVTIMLSIGVTKMAKKNAIIRKLPAVETLGSSSVICSDKTGTLTQNKMKVVELASYDGTIVSKKEREFVLELASMCTDCRVSTQNNNTVINGEPTETAIIREAIENGKDKNKLYKEMQRINDIPFDSERKLMTTIHKLPNGYRIITKGAPDVLLKRCTSYYKDGKSNTLNGNVQRQIEFQNNIMADKALRVLAVSFADVKSLPDKIDSKTIETGLTFARTNWND